jgi:hypothetical protein
VNDVGESKEANENAYVRGCDWSKVENGETKCGPIFAGKKTDIR